MSNPNWCSLRSPARKYFRSSWPYAVAAVLAAWALTYPGSPEGNGDRGSSEKHEGASRPIQPTLSAAHVGPRSNSEQPNTDANKQVVDVRIAAFRIWLRGALLKPESLLTLVLAWSTILLWRETRRLASGAEGQAKDFRKSIKASQRAAKAAMLQARTAERALYDVNRPVFLIYFRGCNVATRTATPVAARYVNLAIHNIGSQAAIINDYDVGFSLQERPFDPPIPDLSTIKLQDATFPFDPPFVIKVDDVRDVTCIWEHELSTDDVERLHRVQLVLYLYGTITYSDPLGVRRKHGFTLGWVGDDRSQPIHRPEGFVVVDLEGRNYDRVIRHPSGDSTSSSPPSELGAARL